MTAEKAKEIAALLLTTVMKALGDFTANWNNGNFYDKWQFRGKVVGNILLEVVLAIFTGGMGNAAKWLGKLGKVAPKFVTVFQKVANKVEKALPDNFKHDKRKDSDAADGKDFDKEQALLLAKMITEGHDKKGSSIPELKANLAIVKKKYPVVKRFDFEHIAENRYKVWMIASKKLVDDFNAGERNKVNQVKELSKEVPAGYKELFMCKEFVEDLKQKMIKNNIKGEIHELFSSRFIWSDKLQKSIAPNGEHIGIKVGDWVFDNLNPNGIEYSKWANDLGIGLTGMRSTNTKF